MQILAKPCSWPNLFGADANKAKQIIEENMPHLDVVIVSHKDPLTRYEMKILNYFYPNIYEFIPSNKFRDFKLDRVRLITDTTTNKVVVVPRCGWRNKLYDP